MERNRDRGNLKWTSLMLPEHLELLRDWQREDDYVEWPELSDWELQTMQEMLETAWKRQCETWLKTWHDGEVRHHQGVIDAIDARKAAVILRDPFGAEVIIAEDIIDVQLSKGTDGI